MAKGYVVVNVKVKDADHYPEYARLAHDAVAKYGGPVARTGTPLV